MLSGESHISMFPFIFQVLHFIFKALGSFWIFDLKIEGLCVDSQKLLENICPVSQRQAGEEYPGEETEPGISRPSYWFSLAPPTSNPAGQGSLLALLLILLSPKGEQHCPGKWKDGGGVEESSEAVGVFSICLG